MNTIKVPKLVFKIEEVDFLSIKNKWAKEQSAPESKTPVVTKVPKIVSKKEQSRNIKAQDARVADYTAHENSVEGLRKMGPPTPTKDASFSVPQMDSTPKAITHQERASVEIPEHIKATCVNCKKEAKYAFVQPHEVTGSPHEHQEEIGVPPSAEEVKASVASGQPLGKKTIQASFGTFVHIPADDIQFGSNKSINSTGVTTVTTSAKVLHDSSTGLHKKALSLSGFATGEVYNNDNPDHSTRLNREHERLHTFRSKNYSQEDPEYRKIYDTHNATELQRQKETPDGEEFKATPVPRYIKTNDSAEHEEDLKAAGFMGAENQSEVYNEHNPMHRMKVQNQKKTLLDDYLLKQTSPEKTAVRLHQATSLGPSATPVCASKECLAKVGLDPNKLSSLSTKRGSFSTLGSGLDTLVNTHEIKSDEALTPETGNKKEEKFANKVNPTIARHFRSEER